MRSAHLLALLTILALVVPTVAAQCELYSDSFTYSYMNNGSTTNRVTFVLLNTTSPAMKVVFDPGTLIILPGQTKNFTVVATAEQDLGSQLAWFNIRSGTTVVARAAAPYGAWDCVKGNVTQLPTEPSRPAWRDVLFYVSITFIVILVVLAVLYAALNDRSPRRRRPVRVTGMESDAERASSKKDAQRESRAAERRTPVNVDAMLREHYEHPEVTPWWLWLLVAIAALIVIGAFIWLLASGTDVTGFNVGAGVNVTNLSNATA